MCGVNRSTEIENIAVATTRPQATETALWVRTNSRLVNRALRDSKAQGRTHKLLSWQEYQSALENANRHKTNVLSRL